MQLCELLDLMVMSQAEKVICGASSMACKLLAVMTWWEPTSEFWGGGGRGEGEEGN